MKKRIAIILAIMITSTTTLFGCSSEEITDSSSVPDTVFQVNNVEDETNDNSSDIDIEKNDTNKSESNDNISNESEKKITESNNNVSLVKATDVADKSNNTASSSKTEENNTNGKITTFRAQAGYTLTFPANWDGKYIIEENPYELMVRYKLSKDKTNSNPWLFSIERYRPDELNYDAFDTIGDIRFFNVGDVEYCIGGPTDIGLSEHSEDFADYQVLSRQRAEVIKSIKVIK